MKAVVSFFSALLLSFACFAEHYGSELGQAEPISVGEALAQVQAGGELQTKIEGEVTSVCQVKGCWMGFDSERGQVRVTFKDYGFFVPFSIVGKTVQVEGTLKVVELSLKDSKHLVEDAGGDPASVTEPMVEYQLVATGVQVIS